MRRTSLTSQTYHPIDTREQRIKVLEDALASLQASISKDTHPVLLNPDAEFRAPIPIADHLSSTAAAFGTLAVDDSGTSAYFGRSSGSEALMMVCQFVSPYHFRIADMDLAGKLRE